MDVLKYQDKELERSCPEILKVFVESLKDLSAAEQMKRMSMNVRHRETIYFFPDAKLWFTDDEVSEMCGGDLPYNFDSLFDMYKLASFINVCKLPYKMVRRKLLRDPVAELLEQYQTEKRRSQESRTVW